MNEQTPDLAAAIVKFIESLPVTISGNILVFVLMYAEDEDVLAAAETFLPRLRAALTQEDDLKKMGAVLRTVAALDHVLWRTVAKAPIAKMLNERLASTSPSAMIAGIVAGEPLRAKHFERALADWSRLRANLITRDNLVDYEDSLLRLPIPGKSDTTLSDQ